MTIALAPWTWWGKYGAGQMEWSYVRPQDNPLLLTSDLVAWTSDLWKDRWTPTDPGDLASPEARRDYLAAIADYRLRAHRISGIAYAIFAWLVGCLGGLFGWLLAEGPEAFEGRRYVINRRRRWATS